MPRLLQMMQRKVPHSRQGYPSEARSGLPQKRQIIMSISSVLFIAVSRSGRDGEAADLVDQRRARDTELVGGPGPVPLMVLQRSLDVLALEIVEREGHVAPFASPALAAKIGRPALHGDGDAVAPGDAGPLADVTRLAHVAPRRMAGEWV